jgi:ribonuclease P/MRP protein subunit POP5
MKVQKNKPLRPSLREKKRYIVFEIISDDKIEFKDIKNSILNACNKFLGEFGCAKANPYIIENCFDSSSKKGILRVTNKSLNDIKAALSMIKDINNQRVIFKIIGVSGILKKAKNKFLSIPLTPIILNITL